MPKSILVADDDKAMINLYRMIFSRTDYSISKASSFAEAKQLIALNNYDLLITDLMFPDGLGTELIKLFEEKQNGAKSLLVTGSTLELEPKLLPESVRYFEKPFKIEPFLSAVTKALA